MNYNVVERFVVFFFPRLSGTNEPVSLVKFHFSWFFFDLFEEGKGKRPKLICSFFLIAFPIVE